MNNLCFGHKTICITQLPRSTYSHPNLAIDLAGEDTGQDVWRADGCFTYEKGADTYWKCVGKFGTAGTRFFVPCEKDGTPKKVHCADGKDRIVTVALTHSEKNWRVGSIVAPGNFIYDEGKAGKATGNHIHLEVAEGIQTTKKRHAIYSQQAGFDIWTMQNELDPLEVFYVNDKYSKVASDSKGKDRLKHCNGVYYEQPVQHTYKKAIKPAHYFNSKYAKTWECIANLHMRNGAGTNNSSMLVFPKGTKVNCYGYFSKDTARVVWLYCQVTMKNVTYTGFMCSQYLK